ncbi:hypothetical protein B296_00008409 [Ensete ventricosum]|uniref:Uncharacterized protein n=1 Tax=Ensete ventricosum TaxID=4639 RepID=A0A427AW60_ENSVE|nr:hypothetical protein B296_00008409 [Ensete ventricosum]
MDSKPCTTCGYSGPDKKLNLSNRTVYGVISSVCIYPMIFISDVSTCQCVMEGFDLVFRAEPSPSNGSISKGEVSAQVIP